MKDPGSFLLTGVAFLIPPGSLAQQRGPQLMSQMGENHRLFILSPLSSPTVVEHVT